MSIANRTRTSGARTDATADGTLLRASVTLLIVGWLLLFVMSEFLHPGGGATFEATFANYAASGDWAAVHLGEFVGTALYFGGLLVLFFALNVAEGPARWLAFFGAVSAGATLVLVAVLHAVDGVALKQAVDAWASAPAAERATNYAGVLTVRWVEWGTTSYQDFLWGLTLVLFAARILVTARIPGRIGYLMGLSGLAWLVLGWLIGTRGFTTANNLPQYAFFGLTTGWIIWLLISALLMRKRAVRPALSSS